MIRLDNAATLKPLCGCYASGSLNGVNEAYRQFYSIRLNCPALSQLIIPDEILCEHQTRSLAPLGDAQHCSVPILALYRNELEGFCRPFHLLLAVQERAGVELTSQYKKDLRETWLLKDSDRARYQQSRRFNSRWMELRVAQWLEDSDWNTVSLEALGGKFDYSGTDIKKQHVDVEIKYIAQQDIVFELNLAALSNGQGVSSTYLDVYSPIDYLLFRVAEAAEQLQESNKLRVVCVIAENYHLSYQIPLCDPQPWIDWGCPQFIRRNPAIETLIAQKEKKSPGFRRKMFDYIRELDEIWVMAPTNGFGLERHHVFHPYE